MMVMVCPECLRALDPLEFGVGIWQNEIGREVQCRHCDSILTIELDDLKLKSKPTASAPKLGGDPE